MLHPGSPSTSAPASDAHPRKSGWRRLTQTAALFLISCIFTIASGELIVRVFVPVRNIGPTFSEYDPYYGKVLKKSFHCVRIAPEFTMSFTTNSYGFRGPEPKQFPKHCILFLGDSFTSGYGVNDGEEFPDVVRAHLAQEGEGHAPPVVNAGLGNTGNSYWLRFLNEEGERYDPRIIVFAFCENDFADNLREQFYFLDSTRQLRENPAPATQEEARFFQRIIEAVPGLSYSHLLGLAREFFSEGMMTSPPPTPGNPDSLSLPSDEITYRIVGEVFQRCKRHQWPTMLLTIGTKGPRLAHLLQLARASETPVIVVPSKEDRPDLYYHIDGHWNAAGHRYVSTMVLDTLARYLPPDNTKVHE